MARPPRRNSAATLDGFFVDFYNQPVQAIANGTAVLRSIGQQRYKGIDVEGALRPVKGLSIKVNVGWSDARYEDYVTDIDGTPHRRDAHLALQIKSFTSVQGSGFTVQFTVRGSGCANREP